MFQYDGYTSCPLITSSKSCILAEFAYDGKLLETFPFNQAVERRFMYLVKRDILPIVYFRFLLKWFLLFLKRSRSIPGTIIHRGPIVGFVVPVVLGETKIVYAQENNVPGAMQKLLLFIVPRFDLEVPSKWGGWRGYVYLADFVSLSFQRIFPSSGKLDTKKETNISVVRPVMSRSENDTHVSVCAYVHPQKSVGISH